MTENKPIPDNTQNSQLTEMIKKLKEKVNANRLYNKPDKVKKIVKILCLITLCLTTYGCVSTRKYNKQIYVEYYKGYDSGYSNGYEDGYMQGMLEVIKNRQVYKDTPKGVK